MAFGGRLTLEAAAASAVAGATCFPTTGALAEGDFGLVCVSDDGIPSLATDDASTTDGTVIVLGTPPPRIVDRRTVLRPLRAGRFSRRAD